MTSRKNINRIYIDYGAADYYKHYKKKNKTNISAKTFSEIIASFNLEVIEEMLNSNFIFRMPRLGFTISIRKVKRKIVISDGKVVNTAPIDWVATKKLWNEDSEAKERKMLVKYLNNHTSGYVFRIKLLKSTAILKNKTFYRFKPSRLFQRSLSKRIKDDNKERFDCFLLYH